MEESPYDVICMVKRHASDDHLCQDPFLFLSALLAPLLVQEPILAFPHRFLSRLGPLPQEPRPLTPLKPQKRAAYISLAEALLKMQPCESTARSVNFLLELCNNLAPEPVPRLPWFEEPSRPLQLQANLPNALARIAPAMRFHANIGR